MLLFYTRRSAAARERTPARPFATPSRRWASRCWSARSPTRWPGALRHGIPIHDGGAMFGLYFAHAAPGAADERRWRSRCSAPHGPMAWHQPARLPARGRVRALPRHRHHPAPAVSMLASQLGQLRDALQTPRPSCARRWRATRLRRSATSSPAWPTAATTYALIEAERMRSVNPQRRASASPCSTSTASAHQRQPRHPTR